MRKGASADFRAIPLKARRRASCVPPCPVSSRFLLRWDYVSQLPSSAAPPDALSIRRAHGRLMNGLFPQAYPVTPIPSGLSSHMADGGAGQKTQFFVQRETAEIGLDRTERECGALGIVDPDRDDDRPAPACDRVGLADHIRNRGIVVHRQKGRARRQRHALDVEFSELRAGLAIIR